MSVNPQPLHFTLDEYFALEQVSEKRFEYWDGEIVCMSGGSKWHSRISGDVFVALHGQLRRRKCEAFTAEQSVKTPTAYPYRYPDVSVVCGEAKFENMMGTDALTNPTVLVEVMSPSSEKRDREDKVALYQAIDSLREYLIIAQDRPLAIHYVKQETGTWSVTETSDLTAHLTLASIHCEPALADVYHRIPFPNQ
ncbi:MAG: Uma2 family endonuclease [Blastocatellia bacterium]|nr:Uma2 family endonuclease [Blastocatellia bacterium]